MLIGREKELRMLTEIHGTKGFRFMVLYGRHRVGKTALLREFARKKDVIYFCARVKNDRMGLADFSEILQQHFEKSGKGIFSDWETAFNYITSKMGEKRLTIIIEEFRHLVAEYPGMISLLQRVIDRSWRTKNIFLILSDSNAAFMENDLLGYASPLYGRITGQMLIMPLDYLDSGKFLPGYSAEDKLLAYGILGGIPCYAKQFDGSISVADNLGVHTLDTGSFLKDEPQAVLRTDFREPAVYNSILEAMACGNHKMNDISRRIDEESQKCAKYLNTLRAAWLVDKITPAGEDEQSRKSLYVLSDNFFDFWYRFVFKNRSFIEFSDPEAAAKAILESESFKEYMGAVFADVCRQYMARRARAGKLPFVPVMLGKWWNGSSKTKKCHRLDLVAVDRDRTAAIYGACKFGDEPFDEAEYSELTAAARSFGKVAEPYFYIFSKAGISDGLRDKTKKLKNLKVVGVEELYKA